MEVGERLVLEVIEKGSAEEILMAKPKPKPEPQPGNNCPINSGTCTVNTVKGCGTKAIE